MTHDERMRQTSPDLHEGRCCPECGVVLANDVETCPNDGTVLIEQSHLTPKLAREYEIISEIGKGGMGVIYKAKHLGLNQVVAIKMLLAHRVSDASVRRFQQEAMLVSSLDHPGIVRIRDLGVAENGQPYIIMDYIEGQSLAEYLKKEALAVPAAIDMFIDVCDIIVHAHERGVVHRDLKPSNIMLVKGKDESRGKKNGEGAREIEGKGEQPQSVKLVDFGIAKVLDDFIDVNRIRKLTQTGEIMGSPPYMSPEQAAGQDMDERSDIYSLGCVMFEVLTGEPPFFHGNALEIVRQQINDPAPTLSAAAKGMIFSEKLEAIIARCLSKEKHDRYSSMQQVEDALRELRFLTPTGHYQQHHGKTAKLWIPGGICTILVIAIAVLAVVHFGTSDKSVSAAVPTKPQKIDPFEPIPFSDNAEEDKKAEEIILNSRNLKSIKVPNIISQSVLSAFKKCTITEDVDLSNAMGDPGQGLSYLVHLPLRSLNLNGVMILGEHAMPQLTQMRKLETLKLNRTSLGQPYLQELAKLPKLKHLSLAKNYLNDADCDGISAIKTLESLNVKGNVSISDKGFTSLSKLPHLRELSIGDNNQIAGLTAVAAKFRKLSSLDVSNFDFTGHSKLWSEITNLPLSQLRLEKITIPDRSLEHIKDMPTLKILELVGSGPASPDLLEQLHKVRPDLIITHSEIDKHADEYLTNAFGGRD